VALFKLLMLLNYNKLVVKFYSRGGAVCQIKGRLESRLEELEPMSDQLRSTELRLQQTVQELNETRQQYAAELQLVRQQLVAVQVLFVYILTSFGKALAY